MARRKRRRGIGRAKCKFGVNKNTGACLLHPRPKKGSWSRKDPTQKQRRSMPASCFADPKSKKYPMCPARSKKPTCQGAQAAYNRARQQRKPAIAKRANAVLKRLGCPSRR